MKIKKRKSEKLSLKSTQAGSDEGGSAIKQAGTGHRLTLIYICLAVAVVTLLVYLPALRNDFVDWDDLIYVVDNPHLRSLGPDFFKWALVDYATNLWHPLTWTSHALDFAIWGAKPFGHHLTNIILHAVNTGIVIWLSALLLQSCRETVSDKVSRQTVLISAAVTGMLFGLHPIHVESVAWVAERKDLLYSLCYMISIIAYLRFVHDTHKTEAVRWYANKYYYFSIGWFFLALCSKPMAVTLPVVLLILDWYPLGRASSKKAVPSLLLEKIPYFILSLAVSLITVMAQKAAGGFTLLLNTPMYIRALVALRALMMYVWKLLVPLNLLPYYAYPRDVAFGNTVYPAALFFVVTVSVAGCLIAKRQKIWLAVWGFLIVSLLPILGIFQAGSQFMADRFMYLPCVGPFLLIGIGSALAWEHTGKLLQYRRLARSSALAASCVIAIILTVLTVRQTQIWKDTLTLWEYNLKNMSETNPEAYFLRAGALLANKQVDNALNDYSKAISLAPTYYMAYIERGAAFIEKGLFDQAIEDENKGIAQYPGHAKAYAIRGAAYFGKGDLDQAFKDFNKALAINPHLVKALIGRGDVYRSRGTAEKAIADYSQALERITTLDEIYIARGDMYLKEGLQDRAIADYQTACTMGNIIGCVKVSLPQ
jgi:Tfp pilus assembly protein PilF